MYCLKCGNELPEQSSFCNSCGAPQDGSALPTSAVPVDANKKSNVALIVGIILMAFGGMSTLRSLSYIRNDWFFTYTAPFTDHEKTVIAILVVSIVVTLAGLISIVKRG